MLEFKSYRKKPVVIQAAKVTEPMDIETLEGVMHANPGDWLIVGVAGEKYPCKSSIFEATYESVATGLIEEKKGANDATSST